MTAAFVLNVDAEFELSDPRYARSDRMRGHTARLARVLRPVLRRVHGAEPWFVGIDQGRPPAGATGDAWCPTPGACRALAACGVEPPPSPAEDVLRAVNHRAFGAGLGPVLPGAGFATDVATVEHLTASAPDRPWLLKRPLGFSGRMRKVVVPSRLDRAARTWIEASMGDYGRGLMVEPLVERLLDVSLHGRLAQGGQLAERGGPVVLANADEGAFLGARLAGDRDLGAEERDALEAAFGRVAAALAACGYHGPFGIDAFRWRDEDGSLRFHPLVEVNARYTFGYWVGVHGAEAFRLEP